MRISNEEKAARYSLVEEIKKRLKIEDVLYQYGALQPRAKRKTNSKAYNIKCPFHRDSSPSFTIWPHTKKWKCWAGCGQGDVINLVTLFTNQPNNKVISQLAKELNIKSNTSKDNLSTYKQLLADREILAGYQELKHNVLASLEHHRNIFKKGIAQVKSLEEMESLEAVYHFLPIIEHWIECITGDDLSTEVETVLFCSKYFERIDYIEYAS
ncbi:CHC2 zinc finger domain-containing protein [Neobacillus drentensis]|uniref:CHC2 zinc finger domain-containing protein n=1 Tax=Neobacillus drentensis TaxID=220684 RepID=UPI002FFED15A